MWNGAWPTACKTAQRKWRSGASPRPVRSLRPELSAALLAFFFFFSLAEHRFAFPPPFSLTMKCDNTESLPGFPNQLFELCPRVITRNSWPVPCIQQACRLAMPLVAWASVATLAAVAHGTRECVKRWAGPGSAATGCPRASAATWVATSVFGAGPPEAASQPQSPDSASDGGTQRDLPLKQGHTHNHPPD